MLLIKLKGLDLSNYFFSRHPICNWIDCLKLLTGQRSDDVLVPRWHQRSTLITRKRSVSRRFHTLSSSIRSLYYFIHTIHYTSIQFQPRSWQCCLLPSYPQIQPVQQRWSRSRLASSLTALTKELQYQDKQQTTTVLMTTKTKSVLCPETSHRQGQINMINITISMI